MYDPENGFYNTFSGGKDSQVLYYIVKMSGVRFQTHMSLTSVDPAEVVRFVNTQYPSVIPIRPKISIYSRAIERGILPTRLVRWCCADFKESTGAGKVTLIGIRKEESTRRAKRHEVEVSSRKFSGNLDEFERWSGTCSTSNCLHPGHYTEDEIAEVILDWWISGKPYKQWYAERYLQLKIDFNNEQE